MQQIIKTIEAWISHQERVYAAAGMKLEDSYELKTLPAMPTRGQLKEWVRVMKER
jgi:hypothetical protein